MKGLSMALMVPMSMAGKEVTLADIIGSLGKHAAALDWQIWWWDGETRRPTGLWSHFEASRQPISQSWPELVALAADTVSVCEALIVGLDPEHIDSWVESPSSNGACDIETLRSASGIFIEAEDDIYWEVQSAWLEDIDALRRALRDRGLPGI